jgi:hypothetical protein
LASAAVTLSRIARISASAARSPSADRFVSARTASKNADDSSALAVVLRCAASSASTRGPAARRGGPLLGSRQFLADGRQLPLAGDGCAALGQAAG